MKLHLRHSNTKRRRKEEWDPPMYAWHADRSRAYVVATPRPGQLIVRTLMVPEYASPATLRHQLLEWWRRNGSVPPADANDA